MPFSRSHPEGGQLRRELLEKYHRAGVVSDEAYRRCLGVLEDGPIWREEDDAEAPMD
jgi:hypothetical protein